MAKYFKVLNYKDQVLSYTYKLYYLLESRIVNRQSLGLKSLMLPDLIISLVKCVSFYMPEVESDWK